MATELTEHDLSYGLQYQDVKIPEAYECHLEYVCAPSFLKHSIMQIYSNHIDKTF
jgi:hypothetical protein